MQSEVWALIGVVLGFGLSELSQTIRRQIAAKKAKEGLNAELKTLLGVIPQKRHIIAQARSALSQQRILPTSGVPVSRIGYDVFYPAALALLDRKARACIHNIYERMIWSDRFLDGFKDEILTAINEGLFNDPYAEYEGRLEELDDAYVITEQQIRNYLAGKVDDVYPETEVASLDPPTA